MNGGEIILADEPTGALDSKSGEDVMNLLVELWKKGHTLILITHSKEVAEVANRVIEIKDGEIVSDTCKSNIKSDVKFEKKSGGESPLSYEIEEAFKSSLSALRMNIFRTILTLLGIVIGVGSVIVMLAIGDGAKQEIVDRISSMGTNLLVIRPGGANIRGPSNIATLVPEDMHAINELDNILGSMPESRSSGKIRFGNNDVSSTVNGTTHSLDRKSVV